MPPPANNSDWSYQPQASYPTQPPVYDGSQPHSGSQPYSSYPPQQGYSQPNPYYQAPAPQYPIPGPQPLHININNVQNGYPQLVADPYRNQAVTALTLGIIAILIWIIPFLGSLVSLICGIFGIVIGVQGRKSLTRSGSATTGLILSIFAILINLTIAAAFIAIPFFVLRAGSTTAP